MAKKNPQEQANTAGSSPVAGAVPQSAGEPLAIPDSGELADTVSTTVEAGALPADNTETRSRRAFFGRSAQLAVMAEFLHRRINVAIPEVDVGDDVFVVKGNDIAVTRVQVKAATAKEQKESYFALINVPLDQLSVPQDTPSLVYVFPVRYQNRWSDFIVIRRSTLYAIHSDGAGTRIVGENGNILVQFRIVFRKETALCGPANAADFQPYRNAWEPWPPPLTINALTPETPSQLPTSEVPMETEGSRQPPDESKPTTPSTGPNTT